MKIAPRAAEGFVAKPSKESRAILLYGPDSGLVYERSKLLIKAYLGENYDPFALVELTDVQLSADHALLADELAAIHMMAPVRVIWIKPAGDKCTKIISAAEDAFNESVTVIVSAGELTPRSSLRQWFDKHKTAASLACYHDEVHNISAIIRAHFNTHNVRVDRDVVEYLCTQLGNDRYVTRQELEKLTLFAGKDAALTMADARALVDYNREANFDDLVNAVADRNLQALEKQITLLTLDNQVPIAYLRILQRYFNKLYTIRAQMQKGGSLDTIIKSMRPPVFFKQVPILTRHAQRWDIPQITRAIQLLMNAELACKSNDIPDIPASSRRLMQLTQIR